ncbi:family 16 glycosylhydrolase [Shewanella olleyana]|uniref:glycoside hydrolase family 16 protein n=1 Tax=Shewanella olleyana TaxID=135626 RepID=UPI00200E351F|nr:glycoside hydrolase family 16 protein [Shewanella olleyana]MCL1066420.1 family 16 glycosylhydrolase [Shewanella olleyana]
MKKLTPALTLTSISVAAALLIGCGSDSSSEVEAANDTAPVDNSVEQPQESTWTLVWSDEFDGTSIDLDKWNLAHNCYGGGNQEHQCYTQRDENSKVADGMLVITAEREDFSGPAVALGDPNYDANDTSKQQPYTSARLDSTNKGDWKYGRFEIRAKMPHGQGTWPAIWMLPTDWAYGPWAGSGEIDIMEAVNLKVVTEGSEPEAKIHGTLHYGKAWPGNVYSGAEYSLPEAANPADDFHVYALEWEKDEIRWYVDDVHFATQRSTGWYSQYTDSDGNLQNALEDGPYNQSFHMILNLAVGGTWAANVNNTGVDESVFPQTLEVDYVRVYECSISPETGQGCASVDENAEIVEGHVAPEITTPSTDIGAGPVFTLYEGALAEGLSLDSYNPDNAVTIATVEVEGRGEVLQLDKVGATGNAYFSYPPTADLSHWSANGVLVFDLNVMSTDTDVDLLVKIDSGWPNVSDTSVEIPVLNTWTEIRLPIVELVTSSNRFSPGSFVDLASVSNPFVIEPLGNMSLQIDNVRYEYDVAQADELLVYDDAVKAPFTIGHYAATGSVAIEQVDVGADNGLVSQFSFNTNEAVVYFQSTNFQQDVSSFNYLEFDLNVTTDVRDFNIKIDCGHPCSSGDFAINAPEVGAWTHYKIALVDVAANTGSSLDLTKVDTPLVLFPAWGNQNGVVMQVDNVKLTK